MNFSFKIKYITSSPYKVGFFLMFKRSDVGKCEFKSGPINCIFYLQLIFQRFAILFQSNIAFIC